VAVNDSGGVEFDMFLDGMGVEIPPTPQACEGGERGEYKTTKREGY